jgi:hypothetical protein
MVCSRSSSSAALGGGSDLDCAAISLISIGGEEAESLANEDARMRDDLYTCTAF